jgi:hypothetical protein
MSSLSGFLVTEAFLPCGEVPCSDGAFLVADLRKAIGAPESDTVADGETVPISRLVDTVGALHPTLSLINDMATIRVDCKHQGFQPFLPPRPETLVVPSAIAVTKPVPVNQAARVHISDDGTPSWYIKELIAALCLPLTESAAHLRAVITEVWDIGVATGTVSRPWLWPVAQTSALVDAISMTTVGAITFPPTTEATAKRRLFNVVASDPFVGAAQVVSHIYDKPTLFHLARTVAQKKQQM